MQKKQKSTSSLEDLFFKKSDLKQSNVTDEVDEEFKKLNKSVYKLTNGNGTIHLSQMSDDEAEAIFDNKKQDQSYFAFFRYTIKDSNEKDHWYRNRFACFTYSETLPVWIVDLKENKLKVEFFSGKIAFHNFIKKIVNKKSFIRSLKRAMYGKVNVEDDI